MPITIRIPYGGGIGAVEHHSESPEALLRPHRRTARGRPAATPPTRYSMIRQAIAIDDPGDVLRTEASLLGQGRGRPRCRRSHRLPAAPGPGRVRRGHRCHPRHLRPAGRHRARRRPRSPRTRASRSRSSTCARSRRSTSTPSRHRCARPAGSSSRTRRRCSSGLGAEIAARITERCFYHLEAPVLRVGGFDIPYPPAKLEKLYLPDVDRILDAVDRCRPTELPFRPTHLPIPTNRIRRCPHQEFSGFPTWAKA